MENYFKVVDKNGNLTKKSEMLKDLLDGKTLNKKSYLSYVWTELLVSKLINIYNGSFYITDKGREYYDEKILPLLKTEKIKEFDYSKWDNKPRMMWVWDGNNIIKHKAFVVFVRDHEVLAKVLTIEGKYKDSVWYDSCAEIEEESKQKQTRMMTNQELAWWLRDHPEEHREYAWCCGEDRIARIHSDYSYYPKDANKPVDDENENSIIIRSNGGEWRQPLIEIE